MDDRLVPGFFADDGQDRGGVDDHAPCSPNPRISSRSAVDTGFPSCSGGTSCQISSTRNLIRRSSLCLTDRRDCAWRTWRRAYRTAPGFVVPVNAATSAARRSVSGSLMFSAIDTWYLQGWKGTRDQDPNQVVSASGSPGRPGSPTQATYPSGRISTTA